VWNERRQWRAASRLRQRNSQVVTGVWVHTYISGPVSYQPITELLQMYSMTTNIWQQWVGLQVLKDSNVQVGLVVYWFVTPCSLIGEYQRCSGTCCLHVQGRSAEYDTNVIHDTVRLQGSSKGSGREIKCVLGQKERCISPATMDHPWNLTFWTTTCVPYSLWPRRRGRTFHRGLDIQR